MSRLSNCKCGQPVRLGALRVRNGVYHYITHAMGAGPDCEFIKVSKWDCIAFKPYPKDVSQHEYEKLIARWNEAVRPEDEQ